MSLMDQLDIQLVLGHYIVGSRNCGGSKGSASIKWW